MVCIWLHFSGKGSGHSRLHNTSVLWCSPFPKNDRWKCLECVWFALSFLFLLTFLFYPLLRGQNKVSFFTNFTKEKWHIQNFSIGCCAVWNVISLTCLPPFPLKQISPLVMIWMFESPPYPDLVHPLKSQHPGRWVSGDIFEMTRSWGWSLYAWD